MSRHSEVAASGFSATAAAAQAYDSRRWVNSFVFEAWQLPQKRQAFMPSPVERGRDGGVDVRAVLVSDGCKGEPPLGEWPRRAVGYKGSSPLRQLARSDRARCPQSRSTAQQQAPRVSAVAMGGSLSKRAPPPPVGDRPGAGTFDDIQQSFSQAQRGAEPSPSAATAAPPLGAARRRWRFSIFGPSRRRQETSLSGKHEKPPKPLKEGGSLAMRGREVRSRHHHHHYHHHHYHHHYHHYHHYHLKQQHHHLVHRLLCLLCLLLPLAQVPRIFRDDSRPPIDVRLVQLPTACSTPLLAPPHHWQHNSDPPSTKTKHVSIQAAHAQWLTHW